MKTIIALLLLTFNTSALSFDTETYCKEVAQAGGGSYMIYERCLKEENAARNRVEPQNRSKIVAPKIKDKTLKADVENFNLYIVMIADYSGVADACLDSTLAAKIRNNFVYLHELYSALHKNFPQPASPLVDQIRAQAETLNRIRSGGNPNRFDDSYCKGQLQSSRDYLSQYKESEVQPVIERLRKQGKPIPPPPTVI